MLTTYDIVQHRSTLFSELFGKLCSSEALSASELLSRNPHNYAEHHGHHKIEYDYYCCECMYLLSSGRYPTKNGDNALVSCVQFLKEDKGEYVHVRAYIAFPFETVRTPV